MNRLIHSRAAEKTSVVLILDCCHSGAALLRGVDELAQPWRSLDNQTVKETFGHQHRGRVVLAACRGDQKAQESAKEGHGIYTYHLLSGLLGEAANPQGNVTANSLHDYVTSQFAQVKQQTPVMRGDQEGMIILGSGFPERTAGVDLGELRRIERKAHSLIDDYRKRLALLVDDSTWRETGFRQASGLLEEIRVWQQDNAGFLRQSEEFKRARQRLNREMHNLQLEVGVHTQRGIVHKVLGGGGFGTVWKVEVPGGEPLAYKTLNSQKVDLAERLGRFNHSYQVMKRLAHRQVVQVLEFTECPLGFYMEFIDGPNLRDFNLKEEGYTVLDRLHWLMDVAQTLRYAHEQGVVHRDVKPENILMRYDLKVAQWEPVLTDFDLAWFSTASHVTKLGMGAFGYAAPEQFSQPGSDVSYRGTTDIYAFAQLSFFVLTGGRDPNPNSVDENCDFLWSRIQTWTNYQAAQQFLELYRRCSQVRPGDRPQSFDEVIDQLDTIQQMLMASQASATLPIESFLFQLRAEVVGLEDSVRDTTTFTSRTGSTVIEIELDKRTVIQDYITLRSGLTMQRHLAFNQMSYEEAQRTLLRRIDNYLEGKSGKRKGGPPPRGRFESVIEFQNLARTRFGAKEAAAVISRVIEIIEK